MATPIPFPVSGPGVDGFGPSHQQVPGRRPGVTGQHGEPRCAQLSIAPQRARLGPVAIQLNDGSQDLLDSLEYGSLATYKVDGLDSQIQSDSRVHGARRHHQFEPIDGLKARPSPWTSPATSTRETAALQSGGRLQCGCRCRGPADRQNAGLFRTEHRPFALPIAAENQYIFHGQRRHKVPHQHGCHVGQVRQAVV